jgi:hypothetical protein
MGMRLDVGLVDDVQAELVNRSSTRRSTWR